MFHFFPYSITKLPRHLISFIFLFFDFLFKFSSFRSFHATNGSIMINVRLRREEAIQLHIDRMLVRVCVWVYAICMKDEKSPIVSLYYMLWRADSLVLGYSFVHSYHTHMWMYLHSNLYFNLKLRLCTWLKIATTKTTTKKNPNTHKHIYPMPTRKKNPLLSTPYRRTVYTL